MKLRQQQLQTLNNQQRIQMIKQRLNKALLPSQLIISDVSHQHQGHPGANGGGHFSVKISAAAFKTKTPLQRHRMIYSVLADLIPNEIHALQITAIADN